MACILYDALTAHISGLVHNTQDNAILYKIQVDAAQSTQTSIWWQVERRYSDFQALHRKLVDSQGVNLIFPPKKLIGNKDPQFVEQRREQLNVYLKNLMQLLGKNPPEDLAQFLCLYDYEIMHMLKKLAVDVFEKGDQVLETNSPYVMSPYQIYAINARMQMPIPPLNSLDKRHDFSHIVDFCTRLRCLEIIGSNIPFGKSTIIANQYSMDLSPFKNLQELILKIVNVGKLAQVEPVRQTVERISVHNSHLEDLSQLLLCDTLYKAYSDAGSAHIWPRVKSLNLSNNVVKSVSDIGDLVPALRHIDLSYNQLCTVFNVTSLPYLEHVSYAGNVISFLTNLQINFGNVKSLDLSQNQIETLDAFAKLYSLVNLNLSCNKVACVEQVRHLAELPCLEVLILTGNPVASSVDYRVRSLSYFGARANDVCIDNERASLLEMDQVCILQAIEIARQSVM